jgi:transposase
MRVFRKKKQRHYRKLCLIELFFHCRERFRGIATRFAKTRTNYVALIHVACIQLWLARGAELAPRHRRRGGP